MFHVSFSRTLKKNHFRHRIYFLLSILQNVISSISNHINTMLPNEMVLAPLQKLKIKYELSYIFNTASTCIQMDNTALYRLLQYTRDIWRCSIRDTIGDANKYKKTYPKRKSAIFKLYKSFVLRYWESNNIRIGYEPSGKEVDNTKDRQKMNEFEFWCLTPLSAIFQLYHGNQF